MKRILFIFALALFSVAAFAQSNTFPSSGNTGIGTASPTHSLTLASASSGIAHYNTSDQTTNYERVVGQWQSNAYTFGTYYAGSGTYGRSLRLGVQTSVGALTLYGRVFSINVGAGSGTGIFDFNASSTGSGPSVNTFNSTLIASSSTQNMVSIQPRVNQSGTAGYSALLISPYEQSTGSGSHYLINAGTSSAASGGGTFTSRFTVDNAGNGYIAGKLGIGNTSPLTALDVNGDTRASSYISYRAGVSDVFTYDSKTSNNYSLNWVLDSWQPGAYSAWLSSYGGIKLFTGGTSRLNIDVYGNIGIGTIHPVSLLAVNGTITTKKIVVTQTGWSDFVFEPSYKLRSLGSVESFIELNHHLPDVPSAKDIEKKGIDVASTQANLLRKIEELTLYIIEQNKKQESQAKVITDMQEELKEIKAQLAAFKTQQK